jgi:hypothetical protein
MTNPYRVAFHLDESSRAAMTLAAYADGVCALRFALCRSSLNRYGLAPDAFPADGFEEVSPSSCSIRP